MLKRTFPSGEGLPSGEGRTGPKKVHQHMEANSSLCNAYKELSLCQSCSASAEVWGCREGREEEEEFQGGKGGQWEFTRGEGVGTVPGTGTRS